MIYFDHNATTPLDPRVMDAMHPYLTTFYGNPSSLYRSGRVVRSAIDTAREQVAALVDAQPTQIIFTSGGTEANNLALNSAHAKHRIVISAVEHPSIIEPANNITAGNNCTVLTVNDQGIIDPSSIESLVEHIDIPTFVSIMLANNETGVIQDIAAISQSLNHRKLMIHTDAVQAIGKIPVSFKQLDVNLMSLSSHKIYGPKGCGALVVDQLNKIEPILIGGGQENNSRAGTENVAAIVGFGKAAELALQELKHRSLHCAELRNILEQELNNIPGMTIFAENVERLPNTVQFGLKGINGEMLLMQLDQKNIAVSSGSACKSGGGKASSVLTAMGVDPQLAKSAIRISLGKDNTQDQITEFITVLKSFLIER